MVATRSNMKLADLNSKSHGKKILRDLIDHAIGTRFCPPPGSQHYKLLRLDQFHGTSHINNNHKNQNEENGIIHSTKSVKISYACTTTTKPRVN